MKPIYHITLDCQDKSCPVQRLSITVEGMPRAEALAFAPEFVGKTGFVYKIAYVIAGFKGD